MFMFTLCECPSPKLFLDPPLVGSVNEKTAVLRSKLNLRNQDNPENIRKIFITPDLTPSEQKRNKELRSQLAEMNKVANIYRIKNGEIVRKEK